jgi:repressor of nif and glnA expression
MNDASIPVLEILEVCPVAISAGAIQLQLEREMRRPPSRSTTDRALKEFRDRSLVRKVNDTIYYELTDRGEKVLAGDLDPTTIE